MGRRWHVSADRHAAAPRRRTAQLPTDGVVAGSRDSRGDPVTLGRAHPLLRHVDRVRGPHGALSPYGPCPARRDGRVRRRLVPSYEVRWLTSRSRKSIPRVSVPYLAIRKSASAVGPTIISAAVPR